MEGHEPILVTRMSRMAVECPNCHQLAARLQIEFYGEIDEERSSEMLTVIKRVTALRAVNFTCEPCGASWAANREDEAPDRKERFVENETSAPDEGAQQDPAEAPAGEQPAEDAPATDEPSDGEGEPASE